MVVPAYNVVIGGTPSERGMTMAGEAHFDFNNLAPVQAPVQSTPSLQRLLEDMVSTVNDYTLLSQILAQNEWKAVFDDLQPTDFGTVVAHVNNDVDQPRVAALVADHITRFTCSHCVHAVRNTADWNRTTVVVKLAPLCVDLQSQKNTIFAELTPWEKIVTTGELDHGESW